MSEDKVLNWKLMQDLLSAPFPKGAIQKTKKEETKKAYNTTGIGYQYLVNRFNDVLGNQWGYDYEILKTIEGTFGSGKSCFDITVKTIIWCLSSGNGRSLVGGHISGNYADALKGAITNSFKKTAAMWGVGREAYEGTLDDDNKPPETDKKESETKTTEKENVKKGTENKVEPEKQDQKVEPEKKIEPELVGEKITTQDRALLNFDQLKSKMSNSKNMYELNARCKKYRPDYDACDKEQQVFIRVERDKRKCWLVRGEGLYQDVETKGIDKNYKEREK